MSEKQEHITVEAQAVREKVREDMKETQGKTLTIWPKQGKELRFHNVTGFTDGLIETGDRRIAFSHNKLPAGVDRYATFNTADIMGYELDK
ncbi:hypothetical protein D922_00050 [Enterococcus faecalis 06-MB-DW-09]|nr:hypothetical protein D922_00050 [Enterococcus faecalis 06-MB-DW-09]